MRLLQGVQMDKFVLLAVDDSPDNLFLMQQLVEAYLPECELVTAPEAQTALQLVSTRRFDGALIDVQMPQTDGIALCRLLKQGEDTRRINVLLITAKESTAKQRAEGLAAGADDFISRPIDNTELVARIRVMLRIQDSDKRLRQARDELELRVAERTADLAQSNERLKAEMAERQRTAELLAQREYELSARNRIADAFLTLNGDEVFPAVLDIVLEVMQSPYGLFGYLDEGGTLVCPCLTREVYELCRMENKTMVFPPETWGQSIWGRSIRSKQTQYSNQPLSVPEGHIAMSRTISAPVVYQDKTIGVIVVASKQSDYRPKDVALLSTLCLSIAPILHARLQRDRHEQERQKAEQALRDAHHELENRVRERTAELTLANEQLQRLHQHQAKLAHVSRLSTVGEMATTIAHELNQPLCAILTTAQATARLLKAAGIADEAILGAAEQISLQAKRAAEMIRHMRDFSRRRAIHRSTIDLAGLIRDAQHFVAAEAKPHKVEIVLHLPESVPPILGDTIQIEQVLVNIMLNAIEAMDGFDNSLRRLEVSLNLADSNAVEVAIRDTGRGLPPGDAERIFEPFFSTKPEGMGIGLPISRSIIESHGGRLWAESPPDGGALFKFVLPTSRAAKATGR